MSLENKSRVLLACLLAMSMHVAAQAQPSVACHDKGQAALVALTRGDYEHVNKDFASDVAAKVTPERLKTAWTTLQNSAGIIQRLGELRQRSVGPYSLLVADLQFSHTSMVAVIGCDSQDRINTFRWAPADKSPGAAMQTSSLVFEAGVARDVEVPTPWGPLPGTLLLPKGHGPFPVVLLLAGSGPSDRDETVQANKPFRDLAEGLAAAGIGSLRYDKRTRIYGKKVVSDTFTVDDEVTDDALAALQVLARQAGVDPHCLYVLGHSLGALMAPRISLRDARLAGLILLAAPANLGPDVLIRQIRYLAPMQGATPAQLDELLAPLIKTQEMLAHADPKHPPAGEFANGPASYWLSLRDYDPIATAKKLRVPMLILQGGGDYQVTPQEDFTRWQAAFAHDSRVKLVEYPGLSHLFMPAGQPPSPADYDKPGHVDAQVLRDIAAWIKTQPARP